MSRLFHPVLTVVCALVAAPAFADLAAEDVWADLQAYSTSFGYEVTGQADREGNELIITEMTISAPQFEAGGSGVMTVQRLVLREETDGSVVVDVPSTLPIEMTTALEDGSPAVIKMDYFQTGMNIVATGSPEDILYTYEADSLALQSNPIFIEGLSADSPQPTIDFTITDLSGTTDMSIDSQRRYDQSLSAAQATYSIAASDPSTNESVTLAGEMNGLAFAGSTALPLRAVSAADMNAMLAAGFSVTGEFTYASSGLEITGESETDTFSGTFAGQQGSVGVTMNADQLEYDVSQQDTTVQMTSGQFPIPIDFEVAEANFQIALPVRQSDDPQDFALGFTLDGFSMSDLIWNMFDPGSQLPRDPAVLALELAGQAKLMFDFLDPDLGNWQTQSPDDAPAELDTVSINKLQVSVAGADLSGTGSFNFETTPTGSPQPVGAVDLTLVGGNTLIDKLVAIGLVPEEQAMGARMMLGLLAVPGGAPDTLNSKIEINEMGHISANGQRIQ